MSNYARILVEFLLKVADWLEIRDEMVFIFCKYTKKACRIIEYQCSKNTHFIDNSQSTINFQQKINKKMNIINCSFRTLRKESSRHYVA